MLSKKSAEMLVGWMSKRQEQTIDYLMIENKVLKEKLGKKRILLNDDQRRRLAVKGKILGRKRFADSALNVNKIWAVVLFYRPALNFHPGGCSEILNIGDIAWE